jgi:hypothetical protein
MKLKVDWVESIALCKHAMNALQARIDNLLHRIENLQHFELALLKDFYDSFQESYDLYYFIYLGHILRGSHYHNEQLIDGKSKLVPYTTFLIEENIKVNTANNNRKYWKH